MLEIRQSIVAFYGGERLNLMAMEDTLIIGSLYFYELYSCKSSK